MKPRFYLMSGFWRALSEDTSIEGIRTKLSLSDAISQGEIIHDFTAEELNSDEILRSLLNDYAQSRVELKPCSKDYFDKILDGLEENQNIDDLCATYLLEKGTAYCDGYEMQYGVVAISPQVLSKQQYLFKGGGIALKNNFKYRDKYKDKEYKDKDLPQESHMLCNSMIIIDPYLLLNNDKTSTIPQKLYDDLLPLLDWLLPNKSSKIPFHLTILSCVANPKHITNIYEELKRELSKISKLDIRLGICYVDKGSKKYSNIESFHSRHIITNNYIIDAEDGFDLFNSNGYVQKNNATLSIVFPRLFGDNRKDWTKYQKWIASAKRQVQEIDKNLKGGETHNRLFELKVDNVEFE